MDAGPEGTRGRFLQGLDTGGRRLPALLAAQPPWCGQQMEKRRGLPAALPTRASGHQPGCARPLGRRLSRGHGWTCMARAGHADNRLMADLPDEYSRVNLSSDPVYRYLRITKGGPGGVPGRAAEQDLVDSAWLQRLRSTHASSTHLAPCISPGSGPATSTRRSPRAVPARPQSLWWRRPCASRACCTTSATARSAISSTRTTWTRGASTMRSSVAR